MSTMEKQGVSYKRPEHGRNWEEMRLSEKFSDVSIKVKDKVFRAHRVVLSATLKYFRSIFSTMPGGNQQVILYLRDWTAKDIEPFLIFAYTSEILITDNNILRLLKQAIIFKEDDIIEACIEYLKIHLKQEQVCTVYSILNGVQCSSLRISARSLILNHFKDCSQTQEFLDLKFEDLSDILSEVISNYTAPHRVFFEGIILWILHDSNNRQMYIYELLNSVDIAKLSERYLLKYIDENREDHRSIAKDVMYCYYMQIEKEEHTCLVSKHRSLMAVGKLNESLGVQYYSLFLKKWCEPREMINPHMSMPIQNGTILNKQFYNLIVDDSCRLNIQFQLAEFSTSTRPNTLLNGSSELLRLSAMCASSKFIYLCGGQNNGGSVSDQVIRYNPQKKVFKVLLPMPTGRCNATATFSEGRLYVLGGRNGSAQLLDTVEMYDTSTKEWTKLSSMSRPREGFGAAVLENNLYIAGGIKLRNHERTYSRSVEVYSPSSSRWQSVARMSRNRSKCIMIAYEGNLLAVGGVVGDTAHETVDVYDPNKDEWQENTELSEDLKLKRPIIGLY